MYDGKVTVRLVRSETRIVVGDSHYGGSVDRAKLWREHGVIVVAPVHYKQRTQLMAEWQRVLLDMRAKIESTFDALQRAFAARELVSEERERIFVALRQDSAWLPDGRGFLDSRLTLCTWAQGM